MSGLDVVSLFAGVGGIDLAARRAGMTTRLLCEVDEPCRSVLATRFPDAVIHPDVRTLTADDIRRAGAVPERTVLTAGFPCQDVSVAGARRGMGEGTRTGLYWHVDRLLAEFRPAWVVLENVPGLLSAGCACPGDGTCGDGCTGETHSVPGGACGGECIARHGGVMGAVLGSVGERGYGWAYRVLDARHFGVPQRRRRVVVVGHLGGTGAASAEILLEPEGVFGDSAAGVEAGQGVAARARERVAVGVLGEHAHTLTAAGGDASKDGTGRGTPVVAFAWQSGGDDTSSGAFNNDGTTPTLPKSQTLAVYLPASAATLTAGQSREGISAPGRRQEDDQNLVAYIADHVNALDTAQGGPDDNTAQGGQLVAYAARTAPTLESGDNRTGGTRPPGTTVDTVETLVAYPLAVRGRDGGAALEIGKAGDPMFALRAGDGGSSRQPLVAVSENQRGELNLTDTAALTTGGGKPGRGYPAVTDGIIVRRLTPLECERLQGFPDGWTDVPGSSDSQRYRQMGNSVAVPVFSWVLSRLAAVHARIGSVAA